MSDQWTEAILYHLKLIAILEPWIVQIAPSDNERIDYLTEEKMEDLFDKLSETEINLSVCYEEQRDRHKAQHYCEQSFVHAK
jgi:fructose-bisphosphate aldolase class 1